MNIDLSFVTYNRLEFTKLSLESILADKSENFSLIIWDNASSDGTAEYLKNEVNDPRIKEIFLSSNNIGQTAAVNQIWANSKADLVGKLDNDCLVSPGWTHLFAKAHEDIPNLGVVAMWHFFENDFDYARAKHKIETINGHNIFRHPWTCGTGLLIKRETFKRLGPITSKAMPQYWMKMAKAGYINGFYYPLVFQEHMDDPKSSYCKIKDEKTFDRFRKITFGLQSNRYKDVEGRLRWRQEIIRNLMDDPFDVSYYHPVKVKLRNCWKKLLNSFKD